MNLLADDTYTDAVKNASSHDVKILESHKHCANMRSSRSISTTCIKFKNGQDESNAKFFPVSVCCTSDYCMMDNEDSSFRYQCENNECYLLKLNHSTNALEIVQAMPQGFAIVEECMETYDGHSSFYPFLPTETMKDICE